jgi:Ca2+-binding RTX toxin-like protein
VVFEGAGDDSSNGGTGNDAVSYTFFEDGGVTANLALGVVTGAGTDTLAGVESWVGTSDDDSATGADGVTFLCGAAGVDDLRGGGGDDEIVAGSGDDDASGGEGDDLLDGGAGNDDLDGGPGSDTCRNGEDVTSCESSLLGSPAAGRTPVGRSFGAGSAANLRSLRTPRG